MTEEEAVAIKTEFSRKYMRKDPWSDYVNTCALSDLATAEWMTADTQTQLSPGALEAIRVRLEKKGYKADDWCITVGLRKLLPNNLRLPSAYKGLRVYICWLGEVVVH
ncbi:MAG: hypothetical protein A2806_04280 [Candidatus Terrybacteria bacterium RIFCSPHIGHO2_01_FULL_48_17]|uniref:Uncharacterized protein n=1 Tax=Candidatus Terrybacteria bacterium RIFCSPHIGHO2_01_FULL_48_17 TaxID=1802362 RepID=A0A1G2PKT0_9BACT|nr:MAG: hypothetical protein A2806_04280 [Candidatus Terrybacteria bacterium RIFCSPHIGHO2_01_FULL_48_17]OHA53710.1 MAG: hypothetical protein A3A30_05055 [Candidatus Terrybacteria bacterium RIFCSPLOWO2_01_FULL_48_14]